MPRKKLAYWLSQILGWGMYMFLIGFRNYVDNSLDRPFVFGLLALFFSGILLTHSFRNFLLRRNWQLLSPGRIILPVICSVSVLALVMATLNVSFSALFRSSTQIFFDLTLTSSALLWLNWVVILLIWSVFYFAFQLFEKSRNEEIKYFRLEAMRSEVELNNLKAQLNPHFIFNSMNSIRALIEENPELAKESITKLSNILRSTLLMGRKKLVSVDEEMSVIHDYLKLESVRYEERLKVEFSIGEGISNCLIPPLMIQTLVENAIKHGISKLQGGGLISIKIYKQNNQLYIVISNTGELKQGSGTGTGIGLSNTRQRLELLYDHKASFDIREENKTVIAEIIIPLNQKTE